MDNRESDLGRSAVIAEEASLREYESTPNSRRKPTHYSGTVFSSEEKHGDRANITPSQTVSTLGGGDRGAIQKINNGPAPKTSNQITKYTKNKKSIYPTGIYAHQRNKSNTHKQK